MAGLDKDDPLRILLSEIIDYAGFFPPASLDLQKTVANFAEYKRIPESWMVARLVLPAGTLADFPAALAATSNSSKRWQISAVVPGIESDTAAFAAAVQAVVQFNESQEHGPATVDAIECRVDSVAALKDSLGQMPAGIRVFWELPLNEHLDGLLEAIARLHKESNGSHHHGPGLHCAKIRTGGVLPELIPTPGQVGKFVHSCAVQRVAFKATAGLHHPVRSEQALSYSPDAPRAVMHGFLNVFLAAAAAWSRKSGPGEIEDILLAGHQESFRLKSNELGVGDFDFSGEELALTRRDFALSFGSCSVAEPVDDLQNMDWLPVSTQF